MGNRVSIKDIAELAGVASSTVSRVLNNVTMAYPPATATREKIFAAVKQLNYTPNINAKRLSQNKSYAIALVIPTMENLIDQYTVFEDFSFMEAMQGIERALYSSSYRLTLIFRNRHYQNQREYLKLFEERMIDGMLIWGSINTDRYLEELAGYPCVQLNSHVENVPGIHAEIDHRQGARLIAEHLLNRGKHRILYIAGKDDVSISHDHRTGYLEALAEYELREAPELFYQGSFVPDCVNPIIDEVLEKQLRFDAVFCVNDNLTRKCRLRLEQQAPQLAAQLDFAGGGLAANLSEHEKYAGICTYQCPYIEMGRQGMQALLHWLQNGQSGVHIKIAPQLIDNRSFAPTT